jgi:hypothetical protein
MNTEPSAQTSASSPVAAVPARARAFALPWGALTLLGAALCLAALPAPANRERLAAAWLIGFALAWSIGLGSLFFLALHYLTGAVWSVVVKRVAEMFASSLWLAVPLFIPVALAAARPEWFGSFRWLTDGREYSSAGQRAYFNLPLFLARSALYLAVWLGFTRYFVGRSLRQDASGTGVSPVSTAVPGVCCSDCPKEEEGKKATEATGGTPVVHMGKSPSGVPSQPATRQGEMPMPRLNAPRRGIRTSPRR